MMLMRKETLCLGSIPGNNQTVEEQTHFKVLEIEQNKNFVPNINSRFFESTVTAPVHTLNTQ